MNFQVDSWSQLSTETLATTLGIELKLIEDEKVIMTMPVGPNTRQPMGILHGGASVALAETAASIGGYNLAQKQGKVAVGQEINANHLRPKLEGIVTATATLIHSGRKSMVWEIHITDEQEKLICISRCTLAVIDPM
ncbi:PaaI family thioesterase [Mechercharimyces sp. CAU 1602]|uniref:PaaI family thioesterase n=1 Tax=Mechercharimyces sp. CAU 1602 TaxID=2973933 RepID=UPI0021620CFC|nr:hotdog fold thioesterase [Mechercharimyces sp. CAU 1602]MCS1352066.1 hotdog fold thioesterase [Mechercharimyces sp. CAU 1602]